MSQMVLNFPFRNGEKLGQLASGTASGRQQLHELLSNGLPLQHLLPQVFSMADAKRRP
jgi:hypothetical protein